MLDVQHLGLSYRGRFLFRSLQCALNAGDVLLIEGTNQSGKTSLLECLAGIRHPSEGSVMLDGHPLHQLSSQQKKTYESSVGYLSQIPLRPAFQGTSGYFQLLKSHDDLWQLAQEWGLAQASTFQELSFSQLRLLQLLHLCSQDPKMLFLDQPFLGFDDELFPRVLKLLDRLQSQGVTLIITALPHPRNTLYHPQHLISLPHGENENPL